MPKLQPPMRLYPISMQDQQFADKLDELTDPPWMKGIHLVDNVLSSGDNTINHKLGETPQGWIITRVRGSFSGGVAHGLTETSSDENFLVLNATSACTIDLWVF